MSAYIYPVGERERGLISDKVIQLFKTYWKTINHSDAVAGSVASIE